MKIQGLRFLRDFDEQMFAAADRLVRAQWWARQRSEARNRSALAASRLFGLLAEDGQLAAFARVLDDGALKAILLDVVLAPEWRGSGLGRKFLTRVLELPELADIDHVELYCEPGLVPYYRELGFSAGAGGAIFMRRENRPSPTVPDPEQRP